MLTWSGYIVASSEGIFFDTSTQTSMFIGQLEGRHRPGDRFLAGYRKFTSTYFEGAAMAALLAASIMQQTEYINSNSVCHIPVPSDSSASTVHFYQVLGALKGGLAIFVQAFSSLISLLPL